MTRPRGGRRTDLPDDAARLLRALRTCRNEMIRAHAQIVIFGPLYVAGGELNHAIDAVAELLTGDPAYFWDKGGGSADGQREQEAKWAAIERGDLPWPR